MGIPTKGIVPNFNEKTFVASRFPRLRDGEWTKTGNETGTTGPDAYNCIAWSLCRADAGWIQPEVKVDVQNETWLDEFDRYYRRNGYEICGKSIQDCVPQKGKQKIALFSKNGEVSHAAKEVEDDGWWESKLGSYIKIMHRLEQLIGGVYGNICRCYCIDDPNFNRDL